MKVAITGSTGLIGTRLADHLRNGGHTVVRLVRSTPSASDEVFWDPRGGTVDTEGLAGIDAAVHLAGETIGQRWTKRRRERILESREAGTRTLAGVLAGMDEPPAVLVSQSAMGYYGANPGVQWLTEEDPPGDDFLADVCRRWEAASEPANEAGIRVVNTRMGLVQSPDGDPLSRMLPLFKLGLGGRLGSGDMWWSWISHTDAVRAIEHALVTDGLRGPVNVVAPEPVTNREYTRVLANVLNRPAFLPVPRFALRLVFGEMADVAILASQRVSPDRLQKSGFEYEHPTLEQALRAELGRPRAATS